MARSGDDVAFGLENRGLPAAAIWPRVSDALDRVGFPYPITRSTAALSGGEAQRLALAGVLALRPGLLLLDEPTANLDPAGAELVREAIVRSRDDTTLIIVEHRVAEALPLVDRVVVLEPGGGVRADDAPEMVFAAYGDRLAAEGVWVPGFHIPPLKSRTAATDADRVRGKPDPDAAPGPGLDVRGRRRGARRDRPERRRQIHSRAAARRPARTHRRQAARRSATRGRRTAGVPPP